MTGDLPTTLPTGRDHQLPLPPPPELLPPLDELLDELELELELEWKLDVLDDDDEVSCAITPV
jgi:hypothetical protein